MTGPSALRSATVPAALVLLLAIAAGLVTRVRATERSHRATVERSLQDYAAFAAWQLARREEESVGCLARSSTFRAFSRRPRPGEPLPSAAVLDPDTTGASCGFARDTRLTFRITVTDGTITTSGSDTTALALVRRLAPALVVGAMPPPQLVGRMGHTDGGARLRFDTLGGARVGVTYAMLRDSAGTARAVYGVVGTLGRKLAADFDDLLARERLLPPSLVGGLPNDSALRLEVSFADGSPAYAGGAASGRWAAADTLPASLGGLAIRVALAPAVGDALLARRLPGSGLPLALALLGGAVALAGVALAQLRRARELERLRTRFVADVSHELRTPLAHIAMFSETLALGRERSAEERRRFAASILRETRRLTMLVERVLRFSRPGGGPAGRRTPAPRPAPRDVGADVLDAVRAFAPLAAAEEVTIDTEVDDGATAAADAGAVRQITFNLLDNAVKYGPRGQHVTVRVARAGAEVRLEVVDEGPGVPHAERERVFEPFTRLERPDAPRVSGTGIGLAVVRDLAAGLGGRVWIEDGPRGARAVCALPAASASAPAPEPLGAGRELAVR